MEELGHLIKLRHEKLDDLREKGISPYINRFKIDTKIQTLVQNFSGGTKEELDEKDHTCICLLYTSPSPRDLSTSRMPSSA